MSTENNETSMEEFLKLQDDETSMRLASSIRIRIAKEVTKRFRKIPEWDEFGYELFFDQMNQEERSAMEWVSEEGINLDDFPDYNEVEKINRNESTKPRLSKLLSDLMESHLATLKRNKKAESTLVTYRNYIRVFILIVGDIQSRDLTYELVERFVDYLPKIPRTRNAKCYKGMDIHQMVEKTADIDESELLAGSTCYEYASCVYKFLQSFVKKKHIDPLVLTVLEGEFLSYEKFPYLPFSDQDLEMLFYSKEYVSGKHKKASNYWVPLLALFTGGRSNEICQLRVSDIKSCKVNGAEVYYVDINQEEDKKLKTKASVRPVPLHTTLISLGFLDYVNSKKRDSSTHLFPEIRVIKGKYNHAFGKWFRDTYRPSCGVESTRPDKRKVFHSFRHTVVQNLFDNTNFRKSRIGEVVGHTDLTREKKSSTDSYIHGLKFETRMKVIESIKYDLDFSRLVAWRK